MAAVALEACSNVARKPTYVVPHVRVTRRGRVYPVAGHRRGTSFDFTPSPRPVVRDVRLHPYGEDLQTDLQILLSNPSAYVSLPYRPDGAPLYATPRTVFIVRDYTPDQLARYPKAGREVSKRWARVMGHEALHLAIAEVEGPKTAHRLDVPYGRFKKKSRGDISRGV